MSRGSGQSEHPANRSIAAFRPEPFGRTPPSPTKIHRLRQSAKTARALLHLAEDAGGQRAAHLSRRIRDWARRLSPLRDAAVIPKTAAEVAKAKQGETFECAQLASREVDAGRPASWWRKRRQEWAELGKAVAKYPFELLSRSDVEAALSRAFRRTCKAARKVHPKDADSAHRWRKRMVVLRGEVQGAAPVIGGPADRVDHDLHEITRRLGQAVDCKLLLSVVADRRAHHSITRKVARRLKRATKRRQAKAIRRARKAWRRHRRRISRALPRRK